MDASTRSRDAALPAQQGLIPDSPAAYLRNELLSGPRFTAAHYNVLSDFDRLLELHLLARHMRVLTIMTASAPPEAQRRS